MHTLFSIESLFFHRDFSKKVINALLIINAGEVCRVGYVRRYEMENRRAIFHLYPAMTVGIKDAKKVLQREGDDFEVLIDGYALIIDDDPAEKWRPMIFRSKDFPEFVMFMPGKIPEDFDPFSGMFSVLTTTAA